MTALLAEEHPELFHYTGISGLEGIIKSQSLWATHSSFLNDPTEINAFKVRLPGILRPEVIKAVNELNRIAADRVLIGLQGGIAKVIEEFTLGITKQMYSALLDIQRGLFIASFCTAQNDKIKQHGLLSQWRGYGQEGGYAIVFDTSRLSTLLEKEARKWGYDIFIGDVVYSSDSDEKFRKELGEDTDILSARIRDFLVTQSSEHLDHVYYPFVRCACRYKHWGFDEEKEVRIIAIPPMREVFEEQKAQGLLTEEKKLCHFVRGGTPVPCVHLFEEITEIPDNPLPITRIIIGPHRDKEKRQHAVESLLSQHQLNIPVTVTEIPYVGNF